MAKKGSTEVKALEDDLDIKDLWSKRQEIIESMNAAKLAAVEAAQAPVLAELAELDRNYTMILSMKFT